MSPKLPRITAGELLQALHRDGWYESSQSGSHLKLRHPTKRGHATVPRHAGRIIKQGALKNILDQAGLSVDELQALL